MTSVKDLVNRFTYHAPREGQPERYQGIRMKGLLMAMEVEGSCPDSREMFCFTPVKDEKELIDILSSRPDYTVEEGEQKPLVYKNEELIGPLK